MLSLVLALAVALQSAAQTPPRRADTRTWYQAYTDGRRAFQQGNWQAAIDSLEAAKRAAGAPKPGRRIPFYGDVFDDYIPDYYLGVAYLNLKQYAAADRSFEAMRAANVIAPRDREYAQFDQDAKAAKAALVAANAAPPQQQQQAPVTPTNPAGNATNAPVNAVPTGTQPAGTQAPVTQNANATIPTTNLPINAAPPPATGRPAPVVTPTAPTGSKNPNPPPRNASSAATNAARPSPANVVNVPRRLTASEEQTAIAAYFSGRYDESARLLSTSDMATISPRSAFYLACSRAALVILGQGDSESLVQARTMLTRAGGTAFFAADRRYISPRVLQMVEARP